MNLFDGLHHQAKLNPGRPAICCRETMYSYGEFHGRVVKLGNALLDIGVEKGDRVAILLLSCGREIIGVEVRVVDDHGHDVKPGEVGEIIARGPNIMQGYWKKEAETQAVLKNGWY